MKKGLLTLFAATLLSVSASSFSMAPVISPLPDITVGDMNTNIGATDNNFFVFTNAFSLDAYVQDGDTTISTLKWSFDEWDLVPAPQQFYTVNGKNPIHRLTVDQVQDQTDGGAAHLNPVNELRSVSQYASFRDIVFSPPPDPATSYPAPVPANAHATQRDLRFWVSDGTNVTSALLGIRTVDGVLNSISETLPFKSWKDDNFVTDNTQAPGSATGWSKTGFNVAGVGSDPAYTNGLIKYDWNAATQSYRSMCYSSKLTPTADYRYRQGGWVSNASEWMPMSTVGTDNYVRGKFYIYAQPLAGENFNDLNRIPLIRLRVAQRYAVTAMMEIHHHNTSDAAANAAAQDLRPSTDPAHPSCYRVDFEPANVPAALVAGEGILSQFEIQATEVQEQGYIGMTQLTLGTYPKSAFDAGATVLKTYNAAAMKTFVSASEFGGVGMPYNADFGTGTYYEGMYPTLVTTGTDRPTYTEPGAGGFTFDSSLVPSNRVGILVRELNPDGQAAAPGATQYAARPRVEAGKQYKVRYHITGTQTTNKQAPLWLRARAIKFYWTSKLELSGGQVTGGAWSTGANNLISQQFVPGVGCQNPNKKAGDTTGGYYTVMMNSPISTDIQPTQSNITGQPGPGVGSASFRDINVGIDLVDTVDLGASAVSEAANYTFDEVVVYGGNAVADK